jgi:glutamate-ammonia-ligase adenylyltransferase
MAAANQPGVASDDAEIMRRLRRLKRRGALAIALADLGGFWPLSRVTQALSALAESTIRAALNHALAAAYRRGRLRRPPGRDPASASGIFVLGMGKLGAHELNYSSDIDLIVFYDAACTAATDPDRVPHECIKIVRDLVRLLDERTADGYVFRTDLRLRPDPGSTPVAVSTIAAEAYYGSIAQNWERAAMIKARAVAGDHYAAQRFTATLEPFIWRRSLDFNSVRDVAAMKRQINAHALKPSDPVSALADYNVKLGPGGIREIEFTAQTAQLVYGGRQPTLRTRRTDTALVRLADHGRLPADAPTRLLPAYAFLRTLEHRLQMLHDHQTHVIPTDTKARQVFVRFVGYPDEAALAHDLDQHRDAVRALYGRTVDQAAGNNNGECDRTDIDPLQASDLALPEGSLVFTGVDDDPETLETLRRLGYNNPERAAALVRGWHYGRVRATRSRRASELLTEVLPRLLKRFGACIDPDAALLNFDRMLSDLAAGAVLLSVLNGHARFLDVFAEIMGSSPFLAGNLANRPDLLDHVLAPEFQTGLPDRTTLEASFAERLSVARDFQDTLTLTRRWCTDQRVQAGVYTLLRHPTGRDPWQFRTEVAEIAIGALARTVTETFAERHGNFTADNTATGLVIIGFGKLGGYELTQGSDLDLVLVYEVPAGGGASSGPRPLSAGVYHNRLGQRLITAITAPTEVGPLYDVDTRLRPSGTAGPPSVRFDTLEPYYRGDAWTWELMALTRARVIAGPPALANRVAALIRSILTTARDPARLREDVINMRGRLAQQFPSDPPWGLKYMPGGIIDIEFIAQYLQLREAAQRPSILSNNTIIALSQLQSHNVLPPAMADDLIRAHRLWLALQAFLRISVNERFDPAAMPMALRHGCGDIVRHWAGLTLVPGAKETEGLISATAAQVRAHFEALLA